MSPEEKTILLSTSRSNPRLVVYEKDTAFCCPLSGGLTQLGRAFRGNQPDIALSSLFVSRRHGLFLTNETGTCYRDTGSRNGTLLNGTYLEPGTDILLQDGDILRIHARDDSDNRQDVIVVYEKAGQTHTVFQTIPLDDSIASLTIGRSEAFALSGPAVSRRHASLFHSVNGWAVIDHQSLNGVFVNGKRITRPVFLEPMDVIRIAGYLFLFTGDSLIAETDACREPEASGTAKADQTPSSAHLSITIEERNVWQRMKKKTLLKDIRLDIPAGSMVLILGGSGAGKTTFMNAVMGYERAEGEILYNGVDIYNEFERMKYEIGYVPQQDLLRLNDTVYETVLNAAHMRMPRGLKKERYTENTERVIKLLGLERQQEHLVGKLSGGQRKRLSIAVEYVGGPALFFLDEPDSGLDGTMARSLMDSLREIADEGKIVMLISHSPDRAFELFDQVIVLAKSERDDTGHLIFYGGPSEALDFFRVDSLEKIVGRINLPEEGGEGLADEFMSAFSKRREEEHV